MLFRSAHAQQVVRFGVRVLLASDKPPAPGIQTVPPPTEERIQFVLPRLRQIFRYSEYTWLDRHRAEIPVGTTERWAIAGERQLEVTPESIKDQAVRFQLRLMRANRAELNANIQAARGNPAVIGGPRFSDGVLIIIVWANAEAR